MRTKEVSEFKADFIKSRAVREFVDRVEPRQKFWEIYEKYPMVCSSEKSKIQVLSYYGNGGIGKTRLCQELQKEMLKKGDEYQYIYCNMSRTQDMRSILQCLKNELSRKYKYEFPLFEEGDFSCSLKEGKEDVKVPRRKSLLDFYPTLQKPLRMVFEAAPDDIIPCKDFLKMMAEPIGEWITQKKEEKEEQEKNRKYPKREKEREQIQSKLKMGQDPDIPVDDLIRLLPELFILDVNEYTIENPHPLVIFLDTYEELSNDIAERGKSKLKDKWLWNTDNGLILGLKNTIWVINGRYKLRWAEYDAAWNEEDSLKQFLLEKLEKADAESFLEGEGIDDAKLRTELFRYTEGIPVFLDLCLETYESLKSAGKEKISIEDFGTGRDEVVNRFLSDMSSQMKDMIYALCILGEWTDDSVQKILSKTGFGFSIAEYELIKQHPFIELIDSEERYLFEHTTQKILLQNCGNIYFKSVLDAANEYYSELLKMDASQPAFLSNLKHWADLMVRCASHDEYPEQKLLADYRNNQFHELFEKLIGLSQFGVIISVLSNLFQSTKHMDLFHALLYMEWGHLAEAQGNYEEALDYTESAFDVYKKKLGDNSPETNAALQRKVIILGKMRRYSEARPLGQQLLTSQPGNDGEEDSHTIEEKIKFARLLCDSENYDEALSLAETVYEWRKKHCAEGSHELFDAMELLASICKLQGNLQRAYELEKNIFDWYAQHQGADTFRMMKAVRNLEQTLTGLHRYSDILMLYDRYLKQVKEMFGSDHLIALIAEQSFALAEMRLGKAAEAEERSKKALDIQIQKYGDRHPDTLASKYNLAQIYATMGYVTKALELRKEVLDAFEEILGKNHIRTCMARNTLAASFNEQGDVEKNFLSYEKAKQLGEENLSILEKHHSDKIGDILSVKHNLAVSLKHLDQLYDALQLEKEVVEIREKMLGESHSDTIEALQNLAITYKKLAIADKKPSYFQQSYELERKIVDITERKLGSNAPILVIYWYNIASTLLYQLINMEEALAYQDRSVVLSKKIYGEYSPNTIRTVKQKILILKALNKWEEAELLEAGISGQSRNPMERIQDRVSVAQKWLGVGNHEKTQEACNEVLTFCRKCFGPDHPKTKQMEELIQKNILSKL